MFSGVGKGKRLLDQKLAAALEAEGAALEPWVLHSLRHTAKTLMARHHNRVGASEQAGAMAQV